MDFFNLKTVDEYCSMSKKIALASFLIGSLILLLYYVTKYNGIIYISMFFMISAFLLNAVFFLKLFFLYFKNQNQKNKILSCLGIMLLNIPIGYLYLELGFHFYGHFTN
jgi:hypothetical protein